jgi:hypothetical protein
MSPELLALLLHKCLTAHSPLVLPSHPGQHRVVQVGPFTSQADLNQYIIVTKATGTSRVTTLLVHTRVSSTVGDRRSLMSAVYILRRSLSNEPLGTPVIALALSTFSLMERVQRKAFCVPARCRSACKYEGLGKDPRVRSLVSTVSDSFCAVQSYMESIHQSQTVLSPGLPRQARETIPEENQGEIRVRS